MSDLRRVTATRYVTPLREGGSLPGLVEADDLGTYVAKFTGAGQGPKALVAEVVAGEIAAAPRAAGARARRPRRRPRHRPRGARLGGPGAARPQRRAQPRHGLPPRRPRVRPRRAPGRRARGVAGAVVRRVRRERRPLLAQPQPAALAPRDVADRPRRLPVLPPLLGPGSRRSSPAPTTSPTTSSPPPRRPAPRPTPSWRGRVDEAMLTDAAARIPDEWLDDVGDPRGLRRAPARPARGA